MSSEGEDSNGGGWNFKLAEDFQQNGFLVRAKQPIKLAVPTVTSCNLG